MRLKLIHSGNFGKSEETLYNEAMKANPGLDLGRNECVLLLSKSRKLMKFVFLPREVSYVNAAEKNGKTTKVLTSEVYRITEDGAWNPKMLTSYAEECGIELEGLKRFAEYYDYLVAHERTQRKKAEKNRKTK